MKVQSKTLMGNVSFKTTVSCYSQQQQKKGDMLWGSSYMNHLPVLYCLIIKSVSVESHTHTLNELVISESYIPSKITQIILMLSFPN